MLASPAKTYFFLTGDTAADLLPRVLIPFTKLGLVPYRVHASTEQGTGEEMSLELRFARLPARCRRKLAARCRAMIGVRSVMTVTDGLSAGKKEASLSRLAKDHTFGEHLLSQAPTRGSPGGRGSTSLELIGARDNDLYSTDQ